LGLKDLAYRIVQSLDPDATPLKLPPREISTQPPLPQGEGRGEGSRFTPEQMKRLKLIRDHTAAKRRIEPDDFNYAPFAQAADLGERLARLLAELGKRLVA
jgi:hypothetical protein